MFWLTNFVFPDSHLDVECKVDSFKLGAAGHLCPQCGSKYCELPVECRACGLTLVSAPHLARSYHHLFPVDNFLEVETKDANVASCFGCRRKFADLDKHVSASCLCMANLLIKQRQSHEVSDQHVVILLNCCRYIDVELVLKSSVLTVIFLYMILYIVVRAAQVMLKF